MSAPNTLQIEQLTISHNQVVIVCNGVQLCVSKVFIPYWNVPIRCGSDSYLVDVSKQEFMVRIGVDPHALREMHHDGIHEQLTTTVRIPMAIGQNRAYVREMMAFANTPDDKQYSYTGDLQIVVE